MQDVDEFHVWGGQRWPGPLEIYIRGVLLGPTSWTKACLGRQCRAEPASAVFQIVVRPSVIQPQHQLGAC